MKKIVLIGIVLGLAGLGFLVTQSPQVSQEVKKVTPSDALKDYSDPSGFSFSYPDNLTLAKKDTDNSTYADILLSANGVNGSLSLKITDSKFKSIDEWAKLNQGSSKETKLGKLKAMEIKTADRLLLGAFDQGILFTIEMPLIDEDFWNLVYSKILTSFSFTAPVAAGSQSQVNASADDVSFEGEEVVE